jgi:hypothetical protein
MVSLMTSYSHCNEESYLFKENEMNMQKKLHNMGQLFVLPFLIGWNLLVLGLGIWAEIAWLGALFGSLVGFLLVLIFAPALFLAPIEISLSFLVPLWTDFVEVKKGEGKLGTVDAEIIEEKTDPVLSLEKLEPELDFTDLHFSAGHQPQSENQKS